MPWKTMDVHEQRVQFVVAAKRRERSFTALCQEFGISRPTGRLWVQRYEQQGVAGIAERSRRPWHSPRRTAAELENKVVEWRGRYPDWGARKLQILLQGEGVTLTRSTLHRILVRHGLVHRADRHQPAVERFERARPNELWQMDFKSPKGWNAPVGPLSVIDDHGRYVIVLQALGSARTELVREQLESVFCSCGVPQSMLMKQGIGLHWSGIGHPQTQGKVERFHGALQRALNKRGFGGESPQHWLDGY